MTARIAAWSVSVLIMDFLLRCWIAA
jgi:hypothetical protein